MSIWPRRVRFVMALFAAGLGPAAASAQFVFVVDDVEDAIDVDTGDIDCETATGSCTLRAAVMQANFMPDDVTIVLPAGTYVLEKIPSPPNGADTGDLNLYPPAEFPQADITILGAGVNSTIIDASGLDRIFFFQGGARDATLSGITLRNGTAEVGGAIVNLSNLTIDDCVFIDNDADRGGAIFNYDGWLRVRHSTLIGNDATEDGGGIFAEDSTTYLSHSTISGNTAQDFGGGVATAGSFGYIFIEQTTLSGNSALTAGGGLYIAALVTGDVTRSTITGNEAALGGGGVLNSGVLYLTNSTISGNRSTGDGGGIFNEGTTWTYNVTIAGNRADFDGGIIEGEGEGGGIYAWLGGAVFLRNSVVAGNQQSEPPLDDDCKGEVGTFGHSVFGTEAGCDVVHQNADATHALIGSLAELGPLQSNGGATETHALLPGSGLIDGANAPPGCTNRFAEPLLIDQRGGGRGTGILCDIGAFEFGALPDGLIFADDFEAGNLWAW